MALIKIYTGIVQCLTLEGVASKDGRGIEEADLSIIEDAAVVVADDVIAWMGKRSAIPERFKLDPTADRIDRGGKVWMPVLVDCHTHAVFAGNRSGDYARRCRGETYQQIARAGGGILSTVRHTREASHEELRTRLLGQIATFRMHGIGPIEIKSGYGLDRDSELKCLEVIRDVAAIDAFPLVSTFLAAHAVPPEFAGHADTYVDLICEEWIPAVVEKKLARFVDIFVEDGFFTPEHARRVARATRASGLELKLHADQFTDQSGATLAVELGATSCDHLEASDADGLRRLAGSETTAVLLPGASCFTGTPYAPARTLLDHGGRVAISTDFNPGTCPSHSLPLMMTLACSQMKMSLPEAIAAATYNAALAIGLKTGYGSLQVHNRFAVTEVAASSYEDLVYGFGEIPVTVLSG